MDYREYPPPAVLADQVECLWRLRQPRPVGVMQTIYPDGRCELIVHLATPPRCWDVVAGWHAQARTLFAAQRVVAVRLETAEPLDCVGVRLRPAASNALLSGAAARYRNRVIDLATLDSSLSRALARAARGIAQAEPQAVWKLLTARFAATPLDTCVVAALNRIEVQGGRCRIDALARTVSLSMRAFQTRFRAAVGLTPKEFARLVRLQATLRALDGTDAEIAALASDGGFADQAHATRELRRDRDGDAAVRLAAAFVRGRSS